MVKRTNKYIEFEISSRVGMPFGMFGGGIAQSDTQQIDNETEYQVATEDDIVELARILGGGM